MVRPPQRSGGEAAGLFRVKGQWVRRPGSRPNPPAPTAMSLSASSSTVRRCSNRASSIVNDGQDHQDRAVPLRSRRPRPTWRHRWSRCPRISRGAAASPDDPTGAQLNLRLAPASLEETSGPRREEPEADLQSRGSTCPRPARRQRACSWISPRAGPGASDTRRPGNGGDRTAREPVGQPCQPHVSRTQPRGVVPRAPVPQPHASRSALGAGAARQSACRR